MALLSRNRTTMLWLLFSIATTVLCWSPAPQPTSATSVNRRQLFQQSTAALFSGGLVLTQTPSIASAASSVPDAQELQRLAIGHARVQYLLKNWDDLTSICGKGVMSDTERKQVVRTSGGGGNFCEKTPLKVQDYLGYKSTTDPLFKADKLMVRAAPLVDPEKFDEYLDVVEQYREKADQGSMMAYTSSWGEANPNGGKDVIDEFLLQTRDDVVTTEKLLRSVLGYLDLPVLPPQAKY